MSISYKNLYIKDHTDSNGIKFDRGRIRINEVSLDLDYGLTRRFAVNLSMPYVTAKYKGSYPHIDPVHNLDDGNYHGAVQDLRFGLRYSLLRYTPVVVTPFAEGIVPSNAYVTYAHAAIGRHLRELLIGTNVGWQGGDSFLSNAYFQTRISYGFVERVLGRTHNRTSIDSEFSYLLMPRLAVSGLTSFAKHHGGLDWDSNEGTPAQQWTSEEIFHHDQLTRADMFDVGTSTTVRVNSTTSVYATLFHTIWSRNAHPLNTALIIGINWSFRTRRTPGLTADGPFDEPLPQIPEPR